MRDKCVNNLDDLFITTLSSSDTFKIIEDVLEMGLDSALQDDLIKNIPIIKWIFIIGKTAINVRDYFLIKKLCHFISGLKDIDKKEKEAFLFTYSKIEYEKRLGEHIIMILDRYDHLDKASLLSKVFIAFVREEINIDEFFRISSSIEKAYTEDLKNLLKYFTKTDDFDEIKHEFNTTKRNLFSSHFSDFYVLTDDEWKRSGLEHPQVYGFNKLAQKFAKIILNDSYRL